MYRLDPASAQEKLDFEGALRHQEKVQLWCGTGLVLRVTSYML